MKIDRALKVDTNRYAKSLVSAYDSISIKIQRQLLRLNVDNFNEILAMEVREIVEALTMKMSFLAVKWTRRAVPAVYNDAEGIANKNLIATGYHKQIQENKKGNIAKRQQNILGFLNMAAASVRDFTTRYISALREAKRKMIDIPAKAQEFDFYEYVDEVVAETIASKKGVLFAKNKIMDKLLSIVADASFVEINGRRYGINYYTDMVARTELARAFTEATEASFREFGADLVEFSRHANPCPLCAEFEGNIYSLSGKSNRFPPLPPEAEIPVHPNCGHALLPVSAFDERV